MTHEEIRAALSDKEALALTIWAEARGFSADARIAVGCVIRNRTRQRGQTYREVCFAPAQFSCWWPYGGPENCEAVYALAERVVNKEPVAATDPVYRECWWIAVGIADLFLRDITRGADHYLTRTLFESSPPKWVAVMKQTAQVGPHVFLRSVDP